MKPAVFFDRDGVLNKEKNYLYRAEDFEWMPGAIEAISFLQRMGYYIFVVTNQSGIARGYYTGENVEELHEYMQKQLAQVSCQIDAFYYCPHHPDFDGACSCRKPEPGMILEAVKDFAVDKKNSFLVGDKKSDIQAAQNAGIRGYIYEGGDLLMIVQQIINEP